MASVNAHKWVSSKLTYRKEGHHTTTTKTCFLLGPEVQMVMCNKGGRSGPCGIAYTSMTPSMDVDGRLQDSLIKSTIAGIKARLNGGGLILINVIEY